VVLEGELDILSESEIGVFAAQTPDNGTCCTVNLVDCVRVAG
jgi:hypothetical protein